MKQLQRPTFSEEQLLWDRGYDYIAGVDEVGRGAFAGPIVAAAVILPREFVNFEINDSKLLKEEQRERLAKIILEQAICYSIAEVPLSYINENGIGRANQLALFQAIEMLTIKPDFVLVDGFDITDKEKTQQKSIIKGDQKSLSIASGSIIAKVYRDTIMQKMSEQYPEYDFKSNKGYGTLAHRTAIKKYGLCELHRTSFNLNAFL